MSAAVAPSANDGGLPTVRLGGAPFGRRNPWARLKKLGFWLAVVLAVVAAGGVLWFLYQKTQAASLATRLIAEQELRQLRQLDSDWDVDILNSKVGLNDSYDPIVAPFQKIKAAMARLHNADGANDLEVQAQLGRMREVFTQKAEAVDGFKSHNSVLRNSLRYLPTAADEAKLAIGSGKLDGQTLTASELNASLDSTLSETLKYAVVTDDEQRGQLMVAAQHLEEAVDKLTDASPAKEPLAVFSNHVRTILKQKADEKRLLLDIVNASTIAAIDKSTAAFDAYFAQRSRESDFWRTALVGFSAFLLLTIAFIGWRLRQSNVEITRVNAALVASNDGLELRVKDRTRELTDTLTSLRESEVQLIQSEKMASLGQMVAGVAHEINTPLAYVRSSLETVSDQLAEVETLVEHSSSMLSAMSETEPDAEKLAASFTSLLALTSSFTDHGIVAELRTLAKDGLYGLDQIREIVVNLRNFSRLDRSKATLFDLRKGLDSTLVIAQSTIRSHQVIKRYADIPDILCAPSQLNQVFLNLITNATHALPAQGGVITLSTEVEDGMVKVVIADNGCGIAPEHLEKIFDPFFTTKEIGKGTGLGLSIAYKIIEEHAGRIGVQSTLGQGTAFSIYLPKTAADAGSTRAEARP